MTTIVQQPQKYSPVNNPQIFQITSTALYLRYFLVKILRSDNSVIATQRYYALPNYLNGTVFDLSTILSNLVDNQIINSTNIIEAVPNIVTTYKLQITDYRAVMVDQGGLLVPTNVMEAADTVTTGLYNVWNGSIQRTALTSFSYMDYVINGSTSSARFLTNKPKVSNIYKNSMEFLYLLNDGTTSNVEFKFYGANGQLLGNQSLAGITTAGKAYRINIDSSVLATYFGDTFNNLYGGEFDTMFDTPFGSYADVNASNYFTVQIKDGSGNVKSELRTYNLKSEPCRKSFQLFFSNNLSGIDNITLFNPKESISNTKTAIQSYAYGFNSSGSYSDLNGGIYNSTNRTISSNTVSSYKAVTGVLSDENAKWIKDIINANEVYVRCSNGYFLPVTLTTNSYNILSKRYSQNNNRLELEFTSTESGLFD